MELSKNKIPLIIAQVEPPQNEGSGDYFYRTHSPGIAMAQDDSVRVINTMNLPWMRSKHCMIKYHQEDL